MLVKNFRSYRCCSHKNRQIYTIFLRANRCLVNSLKSMIHAIKEITNHIQFFNLRPSMMFRITEAVHEPKKKPLILNTLCILSTIKRRISLFFLVFFFTIRRSKIFNIDRKTLKRRNLSSFFSKLKRPI
jgi:hypothetical protein